MQSEIKYPAIPTPAFLTGDEKITGKDLSEAAFVLDFWRWAHSNLNSNAERGIFAEFLIRLSLGLDKKPSETWASYDILWYPAGREAIRIEVKTSSYIQIWAQKDLSKPIFSIRETRAWDPNTNTYDTEIKRQSDIYIFCLETYHGTGVPNPLDLDEWSFYVVPTATLNARGHQKTLSLTQLESELNATPCKLSELPDRILESLAKGSVQ